MEVPDLILFVNATGKNCIDSRGDGAFVADSAVTGNGDGTKKAFATPDELARALAMTWSILQLQVQLLSCVWPLIPSSCSGYIDSSTLASRDPATGPM